MDYTERTIDSRFLAVTPIRYAGDNGHATGFFFQYNDEPYLVTNRHVVEIQSVNDEPLRSVRIHTRPNPDHVLDTDHHNLNLVDSNGSRNWYGHPEDSTIDVAVIPLKPPVTDKKLEVSSIYSNNTYSCSYYDSDIPTNKDMMGARGIVVLGYPYAVSKPYFPVARNALISSPYGFPYRDKPRFMTDARTHSGLSGAPVLTLPTALESGERGYTLKDSGNAWHLVGIHSSTLSTGVDRSLDLNEAWYSELLIEILESI